MYDTCNYRNADEKAGTNDCYENVLPGVYLNSPDGYITLTDGTDNFNIDPGFNLSMTFRTTQRNGTLMAVYRSMAEFVLLDIYNGKVITIISIQIK